MRFRPRAATLFFLSLLFSTFWPSSSFVFAEPTESEESKELKEEEVMEALLVDEAVENDDIFDDEEKTTEIKPPAKAKRPSGFGFPKQDSFLFEFLMLFALAAYGVLYFYGKKQNDKIVSIWFQAISDLVQSNFALVGDGKSAILKESHSDYRLYSSGRRGCHSVETLLQLRKRQDLFSTGLSVLFPSYDKMVMEATVPDLHNFAFFLCKKSECRSLTKELKDVNSLCKPFQSTILPPTFTILTEHPDYLASLLNQTGLAKVIRNFEKYFSFLHVSDNPHLRPGINKTTIRLGFRLPPLNAKYTAAALAIQAPSRRQRATKTSSPSSSPSPSSSLSTTTTTSTASESEAVLPTAGTDHQTPFEEDCCSMFRCLLLLIDAFSDLKVSKEAKARSDKHRSLLAQENRRATHQQRQEEIQKRKEEEFAALPREQQRKIEAKREKSKQRKQAQSKVRILLG